MQLTPEVLEPLNAEEIDYLNGIDFNNFQDSEIEITKLHDIIQLKRAVRYYTYNKGTNPFVESLNKVNVIYNEPIDILIDKDNLYLVEGEN